MRKNILWRGALCALALTGVLTGALTGCGRGGAASSESGAGALTLLTIGTADSGGTMYQAGSAIAQVITQEDSSIKINISASSGSNQNVRLLDSGEVDLALVSGDVAYAALHGERDFQSPVEGLRAIAAVYSSVSSWTVLDGSEAVYVHDLAGSTVGVGPAGSSTELSAQAAADALSLEEQGTTLRTCGLGVGAELLKSGEIAALHGFTGIPIPSIEALSQETACRALLYTPKELAAILEENPVYFSTQIPAGTYQGQTEAIDTFGVKCLLCVREDMDDELAFQLARALWNAANRMEDYQPALADMAEEGFMDQQLTIPLHPGAERFYMGLADL